jgi:hypothetical protein
MAGDRFSEFVLGGKGCPTEAAARGRGLMGVVGVLEERKLCEWEWECDDLGDGLVAVLVTMMGDHTGPESAQTVAAGSEHTLDFKNLPRDPSWEVLVLARQGLTGAFKRTVRGPGRGRDGQREPAQRRLDVGVREGDEMGSCGRSW